ncbi:MAG: hypothetical protein OXI16_00745 [Chloroflexota bacterium]|nr:hypothetical protein [Chloroflexota bacterium]
MFRLIAIISILFVLACSSSEPEIITVVVTATPLPATTTTPIPVVPSPLPPNTPLPANTPVTIPTSTYTSTPTQTVTPEPTATLTPTPIPTSTRVPTYTPRPTSTATPTPESHPELRWPYNDCTNELFKAEIVLLSERSDNLINLYIIKLYNAQEVGSTATRIDCMADALTSLSSGVNDLFEVSYLAETDPDGLVFIGYEFK